MNNPVWENIVSGSGEGGQADNRIEQLTRARLDRERIRMKNFKLEMEEMMRRVENQPTLFQKQSQVEKERERLHNNFIVVVGGDVGGGWSPKQI